MAKIVMFFVCAFVVQATFAAPKKTPPSGNKSQIDQIAEKIEHVVADVHKSLQNVVPDNKQITETLGTQSREFARNIQDIVNKLQVEIDKHKGGVDNMLREISSKLSEQVNALKTAVGPDAMAKANEIRVQFDDNLKKSATEIEKLVKVVQPNVEHARHSIETFGQGVLNDFLKAAENAKTHFESVFVGPQH